jgi:hypothetical protein
MLQAVPDLCGASSSPPAEPLESAVDAVRQQLDELGVIEDRPGLCAAALAMARLLDNPRAVPQHPAAAGQLVKMLGELSKAAHRPRGRLAAVQKMTKRDPVTPQPISHERVHGGPS